MRSYLPSANESGPPSIRRPPPRWLTKFRSSASWSWREERGLEVVEDDRVVAVELVGGLGEAVPQLDLVERAEADQDRLVGPLGRVGVGVVEPVEERARSSAVAGVSEVELRLAPGDPQQADELDLLVLVDGPAEELELPVGPAAHVEHPVGAAPLVDDDEPAVVGQRLLARSRIRRSCPSCPSTPPRRRRRGRGRS